MPNCLRHPARWLISLMFAAGLVACGGGGSDDGAAATPAPAAPAATPPALSAGTAVPTQLITVSDPSIAVDADVTVTFRPRSASGATPGDGQAVQVQARSGVAGQVDVAVPPRIDPASGDYSSGPVSVSVPGNAAAATLQVDAFLQTPFSTEGQVMASLLELAIDNTRSAQANLHSIGQVAGTSAQLTSLQTAQEGRITILQAMVDEIRRDKRLTVSTTGALVVLDTNRLDLVDTWLLHGMVSIQTASDGSLSSTPTSAPRVRTLGSPRIQSGTLLDDLKARWAEAMDSLDRNRTSPQGFTDTIRTLFTKPLSDGEAAAKTWFAVQGASIGVTLSGVGLYATASKDAALAGASKVAGDALAVIQGLVSSHFAATDQIQTDAMLAPAGGGFDLTNEIFLSQGTRLASQLQGSTWGTLINVSLAGKDILSALGTDFCTALNDSVPFCGAGTPAESDFNIYAYRNFDGRSGGGAASAGLADIKLAGNPAFPTIQWPGGGLFLSANRLGDPSLIAIFSIMADEAGDGQIPFGSSRRYGDYTSGQVRLANGARNPSPALVVGASYSIQLGRTDGSQAVITFTRVK